MSPLVKDELVELVLKDTSQTLLVVYETYFQHEMNKFESLEKLSKQSNKALFDLLKAFDLCPDMINKSAAFKIMTSCLKKTFCTYTEVGLSAVLIKH